MTLPNKVNRPGYTYIPDDPGHLWAEGYNELIRRGLNGFTYNDVRYYDGATLTDKLNNAIADILIGTFPDGVTLFLPAYDYSNVSFSGMSKIGIVGEEGTVLGDITLNDVSGFSLTGVKFARVNASNLSGKVRIFGNIIADDGIAPLPSTLASAEYVRIFDNYAETEGNAPGFSFTGCSNCVISDNHGIVDIELISSSHILIKGNFGESLIIAIDAACGNIVTRDNTCKTFSNNAPSTISYGDITL